MNLSLKSVVYYHGTSVPNLKRFKFKVKGKGECADPVSGIWLASRRAGAKWHACSRIKNISAGYVYEVVLSPDSVVVDALASQLPSVTYTAYRSSLPFLKRTFSKNDNWYVKLYRQAERHLKADNPTSDDIHEEIIQRCRTLGIDGILNPLVSVQLNSVQGFNEGQYGTSLLWINLSKVISIKLLDVVKPA
ncbi:UNVERIFIED_ORG: hypothetical protein J3D59_004723 [Pseudomonas fluorescens]